ncbi:MAG: O-antigen/teichoic acid export membrane protein [Salibacteraceae bacterium]|jgi:O-antigen/teichoic acid export membrane protein
MQGSLSNRLLKSGSVQGLHLVLTIVQNIFLLPFFISFWGHEKYGEWLTLYSIFNLLMALDNGFGQYFSNEFNRLYHENIDSARNLLGSSLRVTFISTFAQIIIIGVVLLLDLSESSDSLQYIQKSILPYVLILVLYRMVLGGFKGLLVKTSFPLGLFHKSAMIGLFEFVLELFVLIISSFLNLSLYQTAILFVSIKSGYVLISFYLIRSWNPLLFPWWKHGDLKTGIKHYRKSLPLIFNFISEKFSVDGINILISSVLGPSVLPLFTTTKTLSSTISKLSSLVFQPLVPEIGRLHVKKRFGKILDFFKVGWLTTTLLGILIIPVSFYVNDLYDFWLGKQYQLNAQLYLFLMLSVICFNFGRPITSYFVSINYFKGLLTLTFLRGVISFGLSYFLILYYGILGVGFGMLISEVVVSILGPILFYNSMADSQYKIKAFDIVIGTLQLSLISAGLYFVMEQHHFTLIWLFSFCILILNLIQFMRISNDTRNRFFNRFSVKSE